MAWKDPSPHQSRFALANGIKLNYLDWGGSGTPLIFIHGFSDNPHAFDDIAPAFSERHRVIAYARRGHGLSESGRPYDTATLTADLIGLLDQLEIPRADLAGWSMGGNELTALAVRRPERVGRIVYLDAAYDWSDPAFGAAAKAFPFDPRPPASALASLDSYWNWWMSLAPGVRNRRQIEAFLREMLEELPDGSVKVRMNPETSRDLWVEFLKDRKEFSRVRVPALAIYAESFFVPDSLDPSIREATRGWEANHWGPFARASMDRVRSELDGVEIVRVPGNHNDFIYRSREIVSAAMRRHLTR